jgi:oligoendopeptidase F
VPVYETVMDAVEAEGAPHVHRLTRLPRRVLGVDQLGYFDLTAPLERAEVPPLAYEDAGELLRRAFAPLGRECVGVVDRALRERWIDRADNAGKRPGGGGRPVYGVHPYAYLTWSGTLRDAFVLAHELGHLVHFELAARHQNYDNSVGSGWFFGEAPSALGELLLGRHLLETTSGTTRRWALGHLVSTCAGSIESLLLNARLERRLYAAAEAGAPVTLGFLMDAQAEVFATCYGDAVAVDDGARLFWVQAPHLYVGLYPYTYAAGLACASNVLDAIEREGHVAADRWVAALRAGASVPPLELTRMAGVDMERVEPVRRAMASFGALVDQLDDAFS